MIEDPDYEGPAYYYYKYGDTYKINDHYKYSEMLEFGFFNIEKFASLHGIFRCEIHYFFGYNSSITGKYISSNQLAGQNFVKTKYENWYKNLNELDYKTIIKHVFSSTVNFIEDI